MPKLAPSQLPSYRLHKQSGQAVVTLNGKDVLLGRHDTLESRAAYERVTAQWLKNGRQHVPEPVPLTVVELVAAFMRHAAVYYRLPDGTESGEVYKYKRAADFLCPLYGRTPAAEFGPRALKAIRDQMVAAGWCRSSVNHAVNRTRGMFRWGVENEMVPPAVYEGLRAVAGLRSGRSAARETAPVRPVADALVDPIRPHVSPQVWAIVELQRLTGMRPGEACAMRCGDVDRSDRPGGLWTYVPRHHKNAHRGHARVVHLGSRAQDVLRPFLTDDPDRFVFRPADAEADRRAKQHARRRTPLSCGNRPGTNRQERPGRAVGERYRVAAYRTAIRRACDAAFPPAGDLARLRVKGGKGTRWETPAEWKARLGARWPEVAAWREAHRWHPHQLRHAAATQIRKQFGVEAAQVILGHRTLKVTELYAEQNVEEARRIMGLVG